MSVTLWQFFLEDDVERFRHLLADATYISGPARAGGGGGGGNNTLKIGSPAALGTSPKAYLKNRKNSGTSNSAGVSQEKGSSRAGGATLTRADVNARDKFGRTILHLAASSSNGSAVEFVTALLKIPFLDIYVQDAESGWTALHRALYFGNVAIAQALMVRDMNDAIDYTSAVSHHHAGGLIKIKDREGNTPFEVFGLTIASRTLEHNALTICASGDDDDSAKSVALDDVDAEERSQKRVVSPSLNLFGDEVFAFGSNKNLSLGLGDEDDRQFPERPTFQRPEHLLRRLHEEHEATRMKSLAGYGVAATEPLSASAAIPAVVQNLPLTIQDVAMSKLHTAVITNDSEANLFICGFGPGGRLGTGDETTRFGFVCVETGGLARKRVTAAALGQDHSIAISSHGEVFTWGSNRFGQLGYSLPQSPSAKEVPVQTSPRQLFGTIKKEIMIGAAASSIHSAIFTSSALYTFGKNEGQLGLMDADARSLEMQIIPRRVGVSVLQAPIQVVSAIDRATSVLLESHDVIVLTHFGWTRIVFQLEGFTNYFLQGTFATRYDPDGNFICKVTSGGNSICAMSSFGEVFTVDVTKSADSISAGVSTTNPSKARNALPHPTRVWSIKKSHMAAKDAAVGQDGSIILCTESGSVWRKEKRAKIKDVGMKSTGARSKDYKFVRVPNLTRAVAVRSNAYGAFMAVRKDCDVTREQIVIDPPSIWQDIFPLLPFRDYKLAEEVLEDEKSKLRLWSPITETNSPARVSLALLQSQDPEADFQDMFKSYEPLIESPYDLWVTSTVIDVRIPVHSFMIKARSNVLLKGLAEFQTSYYFSVPDVLSIEYDRKGEIQLTFNGIDFLTVVNVVLYIYAENVAEFWRYTAKAPKVAARYRQVRTELMKVAAQLEMRNLERAARVMVPPARCLHFDMENAVLDTDFFSDADVLIELADEIEIPAHSGLLCRRCPFFDGLFNGRARGKWISSRRNLTDESAEAIRVDLKHIDASIFEMVLRHIYADTGAELFDSVETKDLDDFIDFVIDVMSVANELMLDRLAQICQQLLGKFVTTRNVCQLLNAVAPCSVNEFKYVGLEYVCLNLEILLEHRLLEELDEDLLVELDEIVQQNQLAFLPFVKSGRAQAELLDQYPDLAGEIEEGRRRRIDSMKLRSRLFEDEERSATLSKTRVGSWDNNGSSSLPHQANRIASKEGRSPVPSPTLPPKDVSSEMLFEMDEEGPARSRSAGLGIDSSSPALTAKELSATLLLGSPILDQDDWIESRDQRMAGSVGTEVSTSAASLQRPLRPLVSPATPRISDTVDTNIDRGTTSTPWSATPPVAGRIDLKDMMAQASAARTSNLTLAMNGTEAEPRRASHKMSQKDRKKLQHQQQQVTNPEPLHPIPTPPSTTVQATLPTPKSPWQTPQTVPRPSLPNASSSESVAATSPTAAARRPPARTAMTMRQTVAGTPPVGEEESGASKTVRSVPNPNFMATLSKPAPPQIQSIRHMPTPVNLSSSTSAHQSMADILIQQQTEKTAIKEAVAKRSLQEIQQEQEFQAWWEEESRRVQEEAEAATQANSKQSMRGRGRGGARGRGGGPRRSSGKEPGDASTTNPRMRSSAGADRGSPDTPVHEGSAVSARPPRRGRGRGKARA